MATDTLGNQFVDYVWGNLPPQPDTGRGTALDGTKGFHLMLKNAYNGFPGYTPVAPYLDQVANVAVPDVVGETAAAAETAIEAAGLVFAAGDPVDNDGGATAENDGEVASQTPAAGTAVNVGSTVTVSVYAYDAG
jgi:hypothetical protein